MRVFILILIKIFFLTSFALASESSNSLPLKKVKWPFDGPLGTVDREAAQRGYKIYKEVCATCHNLEQVAYRNLQEIGFSIEETKALAAQHEVDDGPNDEGLMYKRPGLPSDHFAKAFPNENAARATNNGAYPPNLSLIIKAREDGANYLYSLLTGYSNPPSGDKVPDGMYYNPYFISNAHISMAPPLADGMITFDDQSPNDIDHLAKDIVIFLQWAAEPEMEKRKRMGLKVILYLVVMTGLFYVAKKIVWRNIK